MNPDDVGERLVRIEAKLDIWHETHADHETRLRRMERAVWIAAGLAMAGGGVLGQVLSGLGV